MQNFIKTIVSALQVWTNKKIKNSIKNSTADWNQNDSSADNYIKNRTHWIKDNRSASYVEETTIGNFIEGYNGIYAARLWDSPLSIKGQFELGKLYTVMWDSVEYLAEFCETDGGYYFGHDYYISGWETVLPFGIWIEPNNTITAITANSDENNHAFAIYEGSYEIHKLDSKYLDLPTNPATMDDVRGAAQDIMDTTNEALGTKMDKNNPVGIGSFSMGRKSDSEVGENSFTAGRDTTASGKYSHAEGEQTTASGYCSHAEGIYTKASGNYSHAEGYGTISQGKSSFISGEYNTGYDIPVDTMLSGSYSPIFLKTGEFYCSDEYTFNSKTSTYTLISPTLVSARDIYNLSSVRNKYFIYDNATIIPNVISGNKICMIKDSSTTTNYSNNYYKVIGVKVNEPSNKTNARGCYAHIVGNGTSNAARSNAHTLDWSGNAWYQGDVYVGSTSGTDKDEGSKKLATEEYVDTAIGGIEIPEGGFVSYSEAQTLTDEQKAQARANISELVWRTLKNPNAKMPTKLAAYNQYGKNGFDWDKSDALMSPTEWGKENNLTAFEDLLECLAATLSAEMFAEVIGDCAMNIDALIAAGVFDRYGVTFIRDVGGQIYKWLIFINDSAGKYSITQFDERGGSTYITFNTTTNTVDTFQKWYALDKTLTQNYGYAGAKATGDAIKNLSDSLSAVATSGDYNDLVNKPVSDWIPLIDVTLEEPVTSVSTDVDINGKPFVCKDILFAAKFPKDEQMDAGYFTIGFLKGNGSTGGISYLLSTKSSDAIITGLVTVVGNNIRNVATYKGTSEYNGTAVGPYGGLLNGQAISTNEFRSITVGLSNASLNMPIGTIIKVWGR